MPNASSGLTAPSDAGNHTAAQAHHRVEVDGACVSEVAKAFVREAQLDAAAALLRRMRSPVNDAYSIAMAYLRKAGRDAEVLALNAEFRARTVEVAGEARTGADFVKGYTGVGTGQLNA